MYVEKRERRLDGTWVTHSRHRRSKICAFLLEKMLCSTGETSPTFLGFFSSSLEPRRCLKAWTGAVSGFLPCVLYFPQTTPLTGDFEFIRSNLNLSTSFLPWKCAPRGIVWRNIYQQHRQPRSMRVNRVAYPVLLSMLRRSEYLSALFCGFTGSDIFRKPSL